MGEINKLTGRDYHLVNYYGASGCRAGDRTHGISSRDRKGNHRLPGG